MFGVLRTTLRWTTLLVAKMLLFIFVSATTTAAIFFLAPPVLLLLNDTDYLSKILCSLQLPLHYLTTASIANPPPSCVKTL